MNKTEGKKKVNLQPYLLGVVFLLFEAIAFLTFSLGNSIIAYTVIGVVIAILLLLVSFKKINQDNLLSSTFFIFPLILFGIISAISVFGKYEMDMASRVTLPIALASFSFIGYLMSLNTHFKLSILFTVIYSTLAILTLINLITTWIQFGPFHVFFTSEYYIYFDGAKSSIPVSKMAYGLMGFKLEMVKIEYVSLFPSLLLTSVVGLSYISFKKQTKLFLVYLLFTMISLLSLISITTTQVILTTLLILIISGIVVLVVKKVNAMKSLTIISSVLLLFMILPIVLFTVKGNLKSYIPLIICYEILIAIIITLFALVVFKKLPKKGTIKGGLIALGVIAALLFIAIFINGQTQWSFTQGIRSLIANNSVLNRIFNVRFGDYCASTQDIFGKHILGHIFSEVTSSDVPLTGFTGSWFFDLFVVGGLFGFILFLFAFYFGVKGTYKFVKKDDVSSNEEKGLLVSFLLAFFIYNFINSCGTPYVFYSNHIPMYYSGPFFVVVILLSYLFNRSEKFVERKGATQNENA